MKKILVVLLILAMAGGVFAQQGDWSLGGSVGLGTRLDFNPNPDPDVTGKDNPALVDGINYWEYAKPNGELDIGYDRGIAHVGIVLHSEGDAVFDVTFNGDNFSSQFKFKNLISALAGNGGQLSQGGGRYIERLWGEYKFFNGVVTLQAAVASPDAQYWISDLTGTFAGTQLAGAPYGDLTEFNKPDPDDPSTWTATGEKDLHVGTGIGSDRILENGWKTKIMFGKENQSFTKVDHHNYMLVGADIGALSLGIMIPNLFIPPSSWANYSGSSYWNSGTELLAHSLPYTVLGVAFNQSPLEIAAQFNFKTYGIYFGGRFFVGPITIGLSFTGVLDGTGAGDEYDPKQIKIGGRVDYNGGAFGGGIKGFYSRDEVYYVTNSQPDTYLSIIGIEPTFFINAIPSHLKFTLDMGMYFYNQINDTPGQEKKDKVVVWAVQPQVFWNFLGDGAASFYDYSMNTGIALRYRLAVADFRDKGIAAQGDSNGANFVDIIFKWSF